MKFNLKRRLCMLLAFVICAGATPVLPVGAETLQERQQAVVAVAYAYFDKGQSVQYDGATLTDAIGRSDGGKTRSTNQVPPEYATPNETMFTVCSDFAHQIYYEAFRYQLTGSAGGCYTNSLIQYGPDDPITVYKYTKEEGKDVGEEITKMLSLAQVGDIITVRRDTERGHTMIYVGDVKGDGKGYLLHSGGAAMKPKARTEAREYAKGTGGRDKRYGSTSFTDNNGGSIRLTEADHMVRSYIKEGVSAMNMLRPLNVMTETEYPVTAATKYRMAHPRLAIDRTLNKTRFNSAYTGETVTMTLKLKNSSNTAYAVPVTEQSPAGAKLKTPFKDANVSGETQTLNVELAAGEEKTFTCEYEITAKRGETVRFDGGSVGDIPSNVIPIAVGGKKLTAEENAKLTAVTQGDYNLVLKEAKPTAETLGNVVYQKILGLNVQLPEYAQIRKNLIRETETPSGKKTNIFVARDAVAAEDLAAFETLVPALHGGMKIWDLWGIDRCSDPRDKHLEPGDILVRAEDAGKTGKGASEQLVYLGGGKYLMCEKGGFTFAEEPEFVFSLPYDVFYVLRPTLAYDDIHAFAGTAAEPTAYKLPFTDVKESDWFYAYVKELTLDGTVSGMTETTFAPNGTLTYGQALKLITLATGNKEQPKSGGHWASGYLQFARTKKWVEGDVKLDAAITRVAFCGIAAKAKVVKAQPEKNPFTDTDDANVLALYRVGVINGMSETEFQPEGLLTRAQIAKIICALQKL